MVWDLRAALLKKGETESARLDAFEYRLRARAMRHLADVVGRGLTREEIARAVAAQDDEAILADLLTRFADLTETELRQQYEQVRTQARAELIAEFGNPAPHRLA